jgi:hypothetical protein
MALMLGLAMLETQEDHQAFPQEFIFEVSGGTRL